MWPWGHLAVGYVLYAVYTRYRYLASPRGLPVAALAVGTQFPDLVDKPLAYWWILPGGRTLAHSLLVAVPLCVVVVLFAARRGHGKGAAAFAVGYLSHPFADGFDPFLAGDVHGLTFLLWPVFPAPEYETSAFIQHWDQLYAATVRVVSDGGLLDIGEPFVVQIWLSVAVLALWFAHRFPPFLALSTWVRSR